MKKPILIVSLILFCWVEALAVPAKRFTRTVQQSDGTSLTIILCGDEYLHYYSTDDGYPVLQGQDGGFRYARFYQQTLAPTDVLAHNSTERDNEERQYVKGLDEDVQLRIPEIWKDRVSAGGRTKRQLMARGTRNTGSSISRRSYIGKKKGLVILVEFKNKTMAASNPQHEFNRMFNEKGYSDNNHIGSVHDYFYDQSYGMFDLSFDVVGPVSMSENYGYYGSNVNGVDGRDRYPGKMVAEACKQIADQVNFSDYDWDGDGEVEQVFIVYAGYGESNGAPSNTIWPHQFSLSDCMSLGDGEGPLLLNGTKIDTYACTCELAETRGSTMNGIGTACHEFSHCLGLPDFYDIKYNGGYGMGYWDLMCSGNHSGPKNNGEVPCGYSAFERWFAGWLEYEELSEPAQISEMPNLGEEPLAYILYNDNHPDEFFLLENRQNVRWFSYVSTSDKCHGLLVTHVDYDESAWLRNNVNILPDHQRMSIIPANGEFGELVVKDNSKVYRETEDQLLGDLFPGAMKVTELTNTSHDDAGGKLFNRNIDGTFNMNKPIENITEDNGLISFDFMGGIYVPSPIVLEPTDINNNGFTANWESVDGADSYSIELTELAQQGKPNDNILLFESLDRFKTNVSMGDGFEDLSSKLDEYMDHKGWSGLKVFTSPYGAKLGTSSVKGYLTSPQMDSKSRNITFIVTANSSESGDVNMEVLLLNSDGEVNAKVDIPVNETSSVSVLNFEGLEPGAYQISIAPSRRVYISGLGIYDGFYTEENIADNGLSSQIPLSPQTKTVFKDISSNNYTFDSLKGSNYRYCVKAILNGAASAWSDPMDVQLTTGILHHPVDGQDDKPEYYLLNGSKVSSVNRLGLYIVKHKKGKVVLINSK